VGVGWVGVGGGGVGGGVGGGGGGGGVAGVGGEEEEEEEEEEKKEEEEKEDAPLRWSLELDRMLVETVVAEAYDFDAVGELLGERLGRKQPVPAKLCRLRFAAVDRNMVLETPAAEAAAEAAPPGAPATPAAAPAAALAALAAPAAPAETSPILSENAARKRDAREAAKWGEASVMLALPPEDVMRDLAMAFEGQASLVSRDDDDTKVDDAAAGASAVGAAPSGFEVEASGERSELQQVLDFLENHRNSTPAGGEQGGGNSFEELFGIPEAMLDRSVATPPEENHKARAAKEEDEKLFVDRGHFDLSDPRYAATFDRVARAIGAYD
jgi:hypothetical protein